MKKMLQTYKAHVDKKLLIRQRIFFVIVCLLFVLNVTNVAMGKLDWWLAASGFLLSLSVGLLLSRMFVILWHEKKEKVVSKLDVLGGVLLVIYIAIEISRKWILNHWLSGATLNAFGLVILSGLLFGRFLGTSKRIRAVLRRKGKL